MSCATQKKGKNNNAFAPRIYCVFFKHTVPSQELTLLHEVTEAHGIIHTVKGNEPALEPSQLLL